MKNGNPIGGLKIVNNAGPRLNRMNNINIRLNHQNQKKVDNFRSGEYQQEQVQQRENILRSQNMNQNQIQMNAEVNKDKKSEAQERGRGSEKNKKMGTRSSINNNMDLE